MHHAQPRLTDITFLAFDTETNSFFPIMHRLVEVGAVCVRLDGREIATFQQLIDPHIPIPPDVQRVHRITDALVRGKPTIDQILPHLIDFLGESDTILLAHNAPFDLGFLAMALTRLGIAFPPHDLFDTLNMTRRLYATWPSHSLETMAIRLNVANGAEHRGCPMPGWSKMCCWQCCNTLPPFTPTAAMTETPYPAPAVIISVPLPCTCLACRCRPRTRHGRASSCVGPWLAAAARCDGPAARTPWGMAPWLMATRCSHALCVRRCTMVLCSSVACSLSRRSGTGITPGSAWCLETRARRRCRGASSRGREGHARVDVRPDRGPLRGHH
jgi:DNA polymerase III epsilon subunit family exonuclease